jgi:hypothetical protein
MSGSLAAISSIIVSTSVLQRGPVFSALRLFEIYLHEKGKEKGKGSRVSLWRQIEEVDSFLLHLPIAFILQNDAWGEVSAFVRSGLAVSLPQRGLCKKRQATHRESLASTTT